MRLRFRYLRTARAWVQANRRRGVYCPCCGQLAKEYKRPLNAGMAWSLIWLVQQSENQDDPWVDLHGGPLTLHQSRELAKLRHWGLIVQKNVPSKRGARTSGSWRPTEPGALFARGKSVEPAHITLYDNVVTAVARKRVGIKQALGKKFDFDELWNG